MDKLVLGPLAFAVAFSVSHPVFAETVLGESGARLRIRDQRCVLSPGVYVAPDWRFYGSRGGYTVEQDGSCRFALGAEREVKGTAWFSREDGAIRAAYTFHPGKELKVHALFLSLSLPTGNFNGGRIAMDADVLTLPEDYTAVHLRSARISSFTVWNNHGKEILTVRFPVPTWVMVQDNRCWNGQEFSVRIHLAKDTVLRKGVEYKLDCSLTVPGLESFTACEPVVLRRGKDWIPLTVVPDIEEGSALDFSRIVPRDVPAGKHGRVVAKGGHFEFENQPGVPQRFYGVNICFTANQIERDLAKRFAKRLARVGYNALRIHHHDAALTGNGKSDGTTLDPVAMDRLDGIVAACIEEGIYLTTDLFVSRKVPYRSIGVDKDGFIPMNDYKALVLVHEGAFQNLLAFGRQFLSHRNPYTGRTYAEEPALGWLALVNEGNPGNTAESLRFPVWQVAWEEWLCKRKKMDAAFRDVPATIPPNLWQRDRHSGAYSLFLQEVETKFAARMREFLRGEMNCKALMTNMSSWMNPVCYQLPRARCYDFVDDHFYVDHPHFLEKKWNLPSSCANQNPLVGTKMGAQDAVFRRLLDKPFTITEYNYSAPGRFRGVGGIVLGTLASLQDWGGVWRFAWSHSDASIQNPENAKMSYFDMAGDPLSLAAERASICLFRRQDLPPLKQTYAITLPEKKLSNEFSFSPLNKTDWTWLAWFAKMGTVVSDRAWNGARWSDAYPGAYRRKAAEIRERIGVGPSDSLIAGDGAVSLDARRGTFLIRTARTCGGFSEGGIVHADALNVDLQGTPATVWVSSLDGRPVRESKRLLFTHLTDVQNEGITYAGQDRRILLEWGGKPHLMKTGIARVRLALASPSSCRVYSLTTGGTRRQRIATSVSGHELLFTADVAADPADAAFLYEIVTE
ncbi:MAG: hypothetical protein J6Z49_01165 [Kiritimatiellae bacterium]|nr:hypothetical protein [Kiritimatiellia bacterium]